MKIFKDKNKLKNELENIKNISFIPTMGGLHKGHISLIKKANKFSGKTVVSIFVNPKQFNQKKDFLKYPRNQKKDLQILKKHKVDVVFIPNFKDIFSFKTKHNIYLDKFSKKLCGKFRKGHFQGVINVVNRLIEIIRPKLIFFGLKDFQQLYLIKKHLKKRKIKVRLISCKTIREKNGVACSSRNQNLNQKQLNIASNVYKYLKLKKKNFINKKLSFNKKNIEHDLKKIGVSKIDYVDLINLKSLKKPKLNQKFNIFIGYFINKVRLIDNF